MKDSTVNISEVAKILNTTPLNVLVHIKRGLLAGEEVDGQWLVSKASLDVFITENDGTKAADMCGSDCAKKHACGGGCGEL